MTCVHFLALAVVPLILLTHPTQGQNIKIAGYETTTDVTQHNNLDLDQEDMERYTDDKDWENARKIYTEGDHSEKSDGKRTLQGFSTSAPDKMAQEGYYKLYRDYWDDGTYADTFVSNALSGSGDFEGADELLRAECANKGSQYQNVWMYVIHEMEDAINDCVNGNLNDNDNEVAAWDEAVAFYTGSLVGPDPNPSTDGFMLYTLAQKRCADYGTCNEDGIAKVNAEVIDLFNKGKGQLVGGSCEEAVATKNEIVKKMTVPLVQGIHRYISQTKEGGSVKDKLWGEGWAFSAAVLPLVAHCDDSVAEALKDNFSPTVDDPMTSSVDELSGKLQSVYGCLGFGCDDVVGDKNDTEGVNKETCSAGGTFKVVEGTDEPSQQNSGGGLSGGAVAGIVIAVIVVLAVLLGVFTLRKKKAPKVGTVPTAQDGQDDQIFA